jgi:adenylate kinase family enzyme
VPRINKLADNSDLGQKILVGGQGGKSTLARAIAADLDVPYIELDSLSWRPGWVETPKNEFVELVHQALADNPDGWVIDGNYGGDLQGAIAKEADMVVYVNMGFWLMFWRLFWRSFASARDKRVICGENVETWGRMLGRQSLLWFLLKNRKNIRESRGPRLREWARDSQMIELEGGEALNRFYDERGLVRG